MKSVLMRGEKTNAEKTSGAGEKKNPSPSSSSLPPLPPSLNARTVSALFALIKCLICGYPKNLKIPLRHSITVSERGEMCAWEDRKEEEEEERKKTEVYKQHVCYRGHDYRAEPVFIHKYRRRPLKKKKNINTRNHNRSILPKNLQRGDGYELHQDADQVIAFILSVLQHIGNPWRGCSNETSVARFFRSAAERSQAETWRR